MPSSSFFFSLARAAEPLLPRSFEAAVQLGVTVHAAEDERIIKLAENKRVRLRIDFKYPRLVFLVNGDVDADFLEPRIVRLQLFGDGNAEGSQPFEVSILLLSVHMPGH